MSTDLIQRLGMRFPIVQGPFGGGLSTVKLTSTVSNLGGLGSFGAHHLTPDAISRTIHDIRSATSGPFAVNLWVSSYDAEARDMAPLPQKASSPGAPSHEIAPEPLLEFDDQVEAILEARPPVFSFVFGIPSKRILAACRTRGIATLGAATTLDEALALEAAGVDAVLATGSEAGGHRPSFLEKAEQSLVGTLPLVRQVVQGVKIPVIAGGGIADARGVHAALALGAQAAQVGTAFLACKESGASTTHRDVLFSKRASKTALSRGFTGRLARFIRNEYLDHFEQQRKVPLPFPLQRHSIEGMLQEAEQRGDLEHMALYSGQGAPLLRHRNARDLFASLTS